MPAGAPDDPDFSIEDTIDAWLDRGAPRDKLVLGIPYYGQGWTGVTGGRNGLFGTATGGAAPGTFEAGYEDYKVLDEDRQPTATRCYRDLRAGHAWLFDGTTFWTYDDPARAAAEGAVHPRARASAARWCGRSTATTTTPR